MLTDEVASKVLGELHVLTKHIDEQSKLLSHTSQTVKNAAVQIQLSSDDAVKRAKESSRQAQIESAARFQVELSGAVAKTLNQVAGAVAIKSATKWVAAGVVIAGVLTVVAGYLGYSRGKDAGEKYGYAQARDEIAAAAWTHTLEGKQAYQLAKVGSISLLATCKGRGWKIEKNLCVPYTSEDATYGWLIK